jgi:hypothetical protein
VCYKSVTRCYKGVTRVLQGFHKGVTRVLQGCKLFVIGVLEKGCRDSDASKDGTRTAKAKKNNYRIALACSCPTGLQGGTLKRSKCDNVMVLCSAVWCDV